MRNSNDFRFRASFWPRRREVFLGVLVTFVISAAPAQCLQPIVMKSYSVCAAGLRAERNEGEQIVIFCDGATPCATGWGAPPSGLAFVSLRPAGGAYGRAHYSDARDIVAAAPHAGRPAPQIRELRLQSASLGHQRKCYFARRRLSWAGAWDEEYGLEVDGRFFSVWTRYEDDRGKVGRYREIIREILSSVTPL
jgi:hypothetical protein